MFSALDEVEFALARLNTLVGSKDMGVAEAFEDTGSVLLVGSEPGEMAHGRPAIAAFFEALYALPITIGWDWASLDVAAEGDVVWFFAEGHAVLDRDGSIERVPYRLSGVLVRRGGTLLWRQFHGSEPKR
jgi:hypothetical protein